MAATHEGNQELTKEDVEQTEGVCARVRERGEARQRVEDERDYWNIVLRPQF